MNVTFPKFLLLSLLAVALLWGASLDVALGQHSPGNAPKTTGKQLLAAAARRLESYKTLESKVRVRTDLLGQPLVGIGRYAQLDSSNGLLLRMELSIQAGQQTTSIKQISDGRDLWEHWRIGKSEHVNHIDLGRVARLLKQNPGTPNMISSHLASGGLPKLVTQLADYFDFDEHPIRDGELGGIDVVGLTGVWKPDRLAAAAPQAIDGNKIQFDRLPSHLPHQVELILGKEDLFPYRVTYQKWNESEPARWLPVVTTEFFEVSISGVLDASQFHYELPQHVTEVDQTDAYVESLGVASRPQSPINR